MAIHIPKPPGYVVATCVVALAGWLNGYDTGSIGAVCEMPYFKRTFGTLTPFLHGFTVSIIMLTGVLPSVYAGQLADKVGRLRTIMAGSLLFTLGVALQGSAAKLPQFIAGRAIAGVGMGTWMSPLAVYVTEIAPAARRGTTMSIPQLMVTAGICCGYFSAYGTVRIPSGMSWRSIYVVQAAVGVALASLCAFLPESPRWCLLVGRRDRAERNVARLDFSRVEAEKDLLGPAAMRDVAPLPGPLEGLVMIFRRPYRRRTALALVTLGLIQMSGIDGILYYAPTLFSQAGLPQTTASFVASGVSALLMFAITVLGLIFADRFPRRAVMLTGGVLLTACMVLIGSLYASDSVGPHSIARWVVVVSVFVFALSYCATWGLVGKVYASEIQPNATRSAANCVAQGLGFLTNWLVAMLTPILLASSSFSAYFLFAGFCFFSVVLLWAFMPETRGQSLEAIEEAFQSPMAGGSKMARVIRRWFGGESQTSRASTSSGSISGGSVVSMQDMLRATPATGVSSEAATISETADAQSQPGSTSSIQSPMPVLKMETI